MEDLGTVLTIWAHPDDEAYLVGGLSALLTDAGHRVVCVTATRGEAGVAHATAAQVEQLARVRTAELEAALSVLGITEHHWLDYPDGGCAHVDPEDAAERIASLIDDVSPDTVLTFGPDGFTGHPDHQAVSRWTDLALARVSAPPRLLHAVSREEVVDPELNEDFGVYDLGRPRVCADADLDLWLQLEGAVLDRKVAALLRQASQTGGLVEAVGLERFRAWVAHEAFAEPLTT
ncbi:PIG-L deacetylase family protein [Nocardioides sp.]|uniref:PIG-L deacetylase family protein n=1 Tax=Nocardioides sp. TaxID=35761 RepID=UPI0027335544|nr:PIG-L family deacetylase [Nocardioides sp.]MDP3890075.1 PIG-L family deacetylase [Nocardioides sp.]